MSDEPWAFAVTWEGHMLPDAEGDMGDYMVFFTERAAQDYADEQTLEEGDDAPKVVPLYPREEKP